MASTRKLNRNPSAQCSLPAVAAVGGSPAPTSAQSLHHVVLSSPACSDDICHISQRYPNLSGRVLQDQVFEDWLVPNCDEIHSPWYVAGSAGTDRQRGLVRSSVNQARAMNQTTLQEYSQYAKASGLLRGIGSELWAMPGDVVVQPGKTIFYLLTGGTRVEAVYLAHAEDPSNPQLAASMTKGSPRLTLFKIDTPLDVQEYLRDIGNSLNDFSVASTWLEAMDLVPVVNTLFEAEKKRRDSEGLEPWTM